MHGIGEHGDGEHDGGERLMPPPKLRELPPDE